MARRKKPVVKAGAPEWMVTYGDMVTLLLTFFVMLASMANFNDVDERFMAAVRSIREALGMRGQVGTAMDPSVDFHSLLHKLESIVKPDLPQDYGDSEDEGIHGKNFRLRRIRDGMEITMGGPVLFEPFSTTLSDDARAKLEQIGEALRGHRNKIEIRGHAAEEPRPADWTYHDAMALSYARAEAVADELIQQGVDERTLRLVAVGANEPVAQEVYDLAKRGDNRRVEIVVRESLIDDYVGQQPASQTPATQPVSKPVTRPASAPDESPAEPAAATLPESGPG
jgi:chemotaxis protein MotB